MQKEIADKAIRSNAFKEGGVFVANSILTNPNITPLEKLIYAHVSALNQNKAGCFQSTAYIAAKLGCSAPSVKRSIYRLIKLGMFKRVQKGLNGKMRQLWTCDYVGDETVDGYNLDQNDPAEDQNDPREDQNDPTGGIKLIQKEDQNDPDIIPLYNTINTNTAAVSKTDLNSNYKNKDPKTKESTTKQKQKQGASPKVAAKGVPREGTKPRPDITDESLTCRMTDHEWSKFVALIGERRAVWWCSEYEAWEKKRLDGNHYLSLVKWNRKRLADRQVFGFVKTGGWGFYDQYTKAMITEEDYEREKNG